MNIMRSFNEAIKVIYGLPYYFGHSGGNIDDILSNDNDKSFKDDVSTKIVNHLLQLFNSFWMIFLHFLLFLILID